jgi:hypothetical protein
MDHPLTIQVSDPVFRSLELRAAELGKTPEALASECVARSIVVVDDPLLKWAGAIDSGLTDLAERHDQYLSQALEKEMRDGTQ